MPAALIVSWRAPDASRRKRHETFQVVVEAEVEIDALHLAVGDEVGAGAELVIEGEAHRVAQGLLTVVGALFVLGTTLLGLDRLTGQGRA